MQPREALRAAKTAAGAQLSAAKEPQLICRGTALVIQGKLHTILDPVPTPGRPSLSPTRVFTARVDDGDLVQVTTNPVEAHRTDPRELEEDGTRAVMGVPRRLKSLPVVPHRQVGPDMICTVIRSDNPRYPVGGYDIAVSIDELWASPALRARA